MAELDGSIRIGVVIDDKKVSAQMEKLDQKLAKQTQSIQDQEHKVAELERQYRQLASLEAEPKSLKKMEADLKAVQAEAEKLAEELERVSQLASIQTQAGGQVSPETQARVDDLSEKLAYADQRADALQRRIQEIRLDPAASDEARKLAEQLESARGKLELLQKDAAATAQAKEALAAQADEMRSIAESAQVADRRIVDLNRELTELTARMKELKSAGIGLGYEEYDRVAARIKEINAELKAYQNAVTSPPDTSGWSRLERTLKNGIAKRARAASGAADELNRRIEAIGKNRGFDRAGKGVAQFGQRLKSIVAGAFFFNIISRALSALVEEIKKYLMANEQLADGLTRVKTNLLTAFQPITERIIPALNALLEVLQRVTAQIAVFMAQLFGTTAERAQEDAKKLEEEANAAKKAEDAVKDAGDAAEEAEKKQKKYLASFDTIEKLGEEAQETEKEEEKEEDEEKAGFDTDFSEVRVPSWLEDFWKVFKDSWDKYGAATLQAFKDAIQAIWDLLKAIAQTFVDIWTGGAGLEFLNNIQRLLQVILGIVADIAKAFTEAWNSGAGQALMEALFYMLNSILRLAISVGEAFREAWNDGTGVEICTKILNIITNVFNIIGNLANRLREAWEANDNGVAIWRAILGIVNTVLSAIERITAATADWAAELDLEPLVSGFRQVLEVIQPVVDIITDGLAWAWENILLPLAKWVLEEAAPRSLELFAYVIQNGVLPVLEALGNLFQALWPMIQPLAQLIGDVLIRALEALAEVLELVTNIIASFINMVAQLVAAISGASIGSGNLGGFMGMDVGGRDAARAMPAAYTPASFLDAYPHLANGAVISPNSEFLAVLGDQRSGTNIEAPLATIEQALENVLGRRGGMDGGIQVTMNFTGSLAQLARLLEPEIKIEQARLGPNLV